MMIYILTGLFFLTALLYASIGFGGGSTYNALLALNSVDYRILPSVALTCNIIVVTGGVWRFGVAGHIRLIRLAPWTLASVPAAFVGGRILVSETVFVGLLGAALSLAGLHLLMDRSRTSQNNGSNVSLAISLPTGAGLGLLSGIVGIGGGIFLAPILHMLRYGSAKEIAAACSFFILVNSTAGLVGQAMKLGATAQVSEFLEFWPLLVAVFVGGQIGSIIGAGPLAERWMKRITAILVLYVALRLLIRWRLLAFG